MRRRGGLHGHRHGRVLQGGAEPANATHGLTGAPMKTVLLGWDLGQGFSYVVQLRRIADSLAASGYEPVLVLRSLEWSGQLLADSPYPVLQAPYVIGRLSPTAAARGFRPTSFADLMAVNGFGSTDHLLSMQRGWRDLIDLVKPDLVVARYAPLLALAAHGRVPVVVFGCAYSVPPADGTTFPRFRTDIPPYESQDVLLDIVREVQLRSGAPVPTCLTDVYRGDRRVVLGLRNYDPYREVRREPCAGMFESAPPLATLPGEGVHAYLAGSDALSRLAVYGLIASGLPCRVFVRDADAALLAEIDDSPLTLLPAPPDVFAACSGAAVVVHHGGPNTAYAAMASGRPQVLMPRVLDQWLTATKLAVEPFASIVRPEQTAEEIGAEIRRLALDPDAHDAAGEAAGAMRRDELHGAWQHVVTACLDLL